jgi:hypothetical protein
MRRLRTGHRQSATPLPTSAGGTDATRRLASFLIATMQPIGIGEPWIAVGQVARAVGKQRKRRCRDAEVLAALRGDIVPNHLFVDNIIRLRAGLRGGQKGENYELTLRAQADRLHMLALAIHTGGRAPRTQNSRPNSRFKKFAFWAAGVTGAALLTLATGAVPGIMGQIFNNASIEDHIRPGPDIIVHESLYYPDGSGVPEPTVAAGGFHASDELARTLSRSGAVSSAPVLRQIQAAHGVDVQSVFIRVVLQGNSNEQVQILNVKPVQLQRSAPLNGTLFEIGPQGAVSNIQMGFDLDQPLPQALNVTGSEFPVMTREPYFEEHSISLGKGGTAVVVIEATTQCYGASFKLAVSYLVGNASRQFIISNGGGPFRVTGIRYSRNGTMSYRQIFALQGNFSAIQPDQQQLSAYRRPKGAEECPA